MTFLEMDSDKFWATPDGWEWSEEVSTELDVRTALFFLGDPNDDSTPIAVALELQPGGQILRHSHPCDRFEVIVRGSLEIEKGRFLTVGDVMVAKEGEMYGPHRAGPEGCTTIEVFGKISGIKSITYATTDGDLPMQLNAGHIQPENAIRVDF